MTITFGSISVIEIPPSIVKSSTPKFNYRKGDYSSMNNYFETIDWLEIMSFDSIQNNWDIFKQLVSDATIQYIPTSVSRPNKSPPW